MAINFPGTPSNGDTFTQGTTTWQYNGTGWAIKDSTVSNTVFKTFLADTGTTTADAVNDSFTLEGGTDISTAITGDKVVIAYTGSGSGGAGDVFKTVTSDDGSAVASGSTDTLSVLGGTNIATAVATDTKNVTVNMTAHSINFLSDVDTTSSPPSSGNVLKWDGAKWAPGIDATTGGAGTDADTLDGQDGSYYLDYNNLNNKPTILALSALSIGVELSPLGDGAISYDNTTGVFRYRPPTAAGIGALTAEINDLTAAVTWANVPNANITQTSVTQHQSALSITESQISDLGSYLTSVSASNLSAISVDALSDVNTTTVAPSDGQVLMWDNGNGYWKPSTVSGGGGGEANQNAFSTIAVAGQSNVEADSTTDTLTFTAGSGISITTNAGSDTLTITSTVSSGATSLTGLTDVSTAGLNVSQIYRPAIAMLAVTANGSSAYLFNSHYSGNNPTISAFKGSTLAFDLSGAGGHPFQIQDAGGSPYNTGLVHVTTSGTVTTGTNAQGKSSGTLYWNIPSGAGSTYRYQCTSHGSMNGLISLTPI
tara:strand:+ start:6441 stop:8060 length:1620 start_codon:yes stop_codon:yes gene_type:complete